jgi:predicted kinase
MEFSHGMSCIDVLYDLAFLLMDLTHRGFGEANLVLNRFLDLSADSDGLPALPLFLSLRAAIRAYVLGPLHRRNPAAETLREAQSYLSLAATLLQLQQPCLVAVAGLSGTGKINAGAGTGRQPAAGARRAAGSQRRPAQAALRRRTGDAAVARRLRPRDHGAVYRLSHDKAATALAAGYSAIVDATFLRQEERVAIAATVKRSGAPFLGLWLEAPSDVLAGRVAARSGEASDAHAHVLQRQFVAETGAIAWHRLDATRDLAMTAAATARDLLARTE